MQPARATRGERQREQRVEHRGDRKVRQPHPVEAPRLERLGGERHHVRSRERSGVRTDGEANFHALTAYDRTTGRSRLGRASHAEPALARGVELV